MDSDDDLDRILEQCLQRLSDEEPIHDPLGLLELLPEESQPVREWMLVELIKLDLSLAAERGESRRIEWYLERLGHCLPVDRVPLDLVLEERQVRKDRGECPPPSEFIARFPMLGQLLEQLLEPPESTTSAAHREPLPELTAGDQIDDFIILSPLGRGAFAVVYLARQISMQRLVALKVSRGVGCEPVSLARLDHPNIVRVLDQRVLPDRGVHLMYMQYLPGGTLADVVRAVRSAEREKVTSDRTLESLAGSVVLDSVDRHLLTAAQLVPERSSVRQWLADAPWPAAVAWIGVQLAHALDHAHQAGVLHRDVKPANVLLTAEAIPKLADFNVSHAGTEDLSKADVEAGAGVGADADADTDCQPCTAGPLGKSLGGSIAYMAPEHLRAVSTSRPAENAEVGPAADLYSLGVLLWELWQGERPFEATREASSWTAAVAEQLATRERPLVAPRRTGGVRERVLENTLRHCLTPRPEERPTSGRELAGRLRLALHPEAAGIFEPEPRGVVHRLLTISPWLMIGAVVFLPNVAAGVFNYYYNAREIISRHPEMSEDFRRLAYLVNSTFFPLGLVIAVALTRPVAVAVSAAKKNRREGMDGRAVHGLVALGRRAALVGGGLWLTGGVVYATVLSLTHDSFLRIEAVHFVMSLLICGGVAAVYPYFAMTALTTHIYYPLLVRKTMQDPHFDDHAQQTQAANGIFLMQAVVIPLLAIVLLVSRDVIAKDIIMIAAGATAVGSFVSFAIYRRVTIAWERMGEILSGKQGSSSFEN